MNSKKSKRFQESPWYIKLWRFRFYALIPYDAIRTYVKDPNFVDGKFSLAWDIAKGSCHRKMGWYYTAQEINEMWVRDAGF